MLNEIYIYIHIYIHIGWGVWGNNFLKYRAEIVLDKIDNGTLLSSEKEYKNAVFEAYPLYQ